MIIWQGFGFLAGLIPILCYVALVTLFQHVKGQMYTDSHSWVGALATLIGAALVGLLALQLQNRPGRTLLDPATGNTVVLRKKHTFFFIPMLWWAAVLAVAAAWMLVFKSGSPL